MNRFILAAFLLVAIFAVSEAAVAKKKVKEGESLVIDSFENGQGIVRTVAAGEQTFHFNGPEKGAFLDSDWKEVDPSNYQMGSSHQKIHQG
ncbi:Cold-shock protein [Caenorhabditis elegans]|uniref:Cold-shock protein n=1 Tax=Caenorhabditis elegans TaxID=6239 RepID=P91520_CAEEL|nr:Cold-shock protein [Caenorhabditis elegans]CCD70563.1 Cold-shock protein [Caenorhabditis elegans]|eukprot:NP_503903.1 Uncharacterized protein CELE_T28A11.4 [Caenorhabditis elegans]